MIRFLTYIDNWLNRCHERIKLTVTIDAEALAYFRIFFGICMLLFYLPSWGWLSEVPPGFFNPRIFSVANLADNHLPYLVYLISDILVICLFLFLILGIYTRIVLIVLFVLSSILYSFSYSFNKIDHHTTILMFSYLCMAFTNIGAKLALSEDKMLPKNTQQIALGLFGVIICFGLFTAGFPKFINWIDFDLGTSGFLHWFYPGFFNIDNNKLLAPVVFDIPIIFLEMADYIAAIFEISGFYFLWKGRKQWIFYLTIATLFHLMNLLVLNIDFTLNVLCYGIFILPAWLLSFSKKVDFSSKKYLSLGIFIIVLIGVIKIFMVFNDFKNDIMSSFAIQNGINIFISLFTVIIGIFVISRPVFSIENSGRSI